MSLTNFAGGSPFANFRKKLTAAEKDEEKEKDEDKSKKAEDKEEEKEKDEDKEKSKSKAEDEDEEKKKRDEESKKSKAEDEDEEKDKEKKSKSEDEEPEAHVARIRTNERARIRAIIESEPGQANLEGAYEMAMNSDVSVSTALAFLKAAGPKSSATASDPPLRERMAGTQQPDIGASDARPSPNLAEQFVRAYKKSRGETV